jgi:hypothetical protein
MKVPNQIESLTATILQMESMLAQAKTQMELLKAQVASQSPLDDKSDETRSTSPPDNAPTIQSKDY